MFDQIIKTHFVYIILLRSFQGNNFVKFMYQFKPKTKTLIRKIERILIKLYKHCVFII